MAATYYVQVDGDDQNSGTSSTIDGAWRSLNFAFDQLKGGDTLIIGDGLTPIRAEAGGLQLKTQRLLRHSILGELKFAWTEILNMEMC